VAINAQDVKVLREKTGAGIMDCKKALTENNGDIDQAVLYLKEKGLAEAKKRSGREAKDGKIAVVFAAGGNVALMVEVNCETDFVSRTDEYHAFSQDVAKAILEEGSSSVEDLSQSIKDRVKDAIASFGENILIRKVVRFEKSDAQKSVFHSYIHMGGKVGVIVEFLIQGDGFAENSAVKEFENNVALQIASMAPVSVSRDEFPEELLEEQRGIFMTQAKESGKPENILEKIVTGKMNKYFAESCLLEQKYVKDSDVTIDTYLEQVVQEAAEASASEGSIEIKRFARFKLGEE
jgi:elongation factor Ts